MKAACRSLATIVMLFASSSMAAAQTTIDFNSLPNSSNAIRTTPLTTQGFTFASGHFHQIDNPLGISNGTTTLGEEGGSLGLPITMTGGGLFSLNGFDGAGIFNPQVTGFPNATFINLLGNVFGGGTLTASFGLTPTTFSTFFLPASWTNLTSVVFSGSIPTANNPNAGFQLDNIVVNAPTATPEPSTIALLATGLVGIAGVVRRRRLA